MKTISIIVPCYNEEESLPIFYHQVTEILKDIPCNYELILVNDGSKDKTLQLMEELSQKDTHVRYYSFSRNFGKESAMYAGLNNAKGDYVGVMDVDLQDPPSLLVDMFNILEQGEFDCVATKRKNRKGEPPIRSFFAQLFYIIINKITTAEIINGARDFRLLKREMVDAILNMAEYDRFSKGIFGWIGFKIKWLEYENIERVAGVTKWNFMKLLRYAIDGIINFSNFPIDFVAYCGVGMCIISFIVIIIRIVVGANSDINGYYFHLLISILVLLSGIITTFIAIIGQYIGKTYSQVQKRPHYIIAKSNDPICKKIN